MSTLPRGLRNNNPGNIRDSTINWLGETGQNLDTSFEEFKTIADGYRAMFVLLSSYIKKGVDTIPAIIAKWAPPTENNTENYISFVVNKTKIPRNQVLTNYDGELIVKIVAAISEKENGVAANMSDVEKGFSLQSVIKKKTT